MQKNSLLQFVLLFIIAVPIVWWLKQEQPQETPLLSLENAANLAPDKIQSLDLSTSNLQRIPDQLLGYKTLVSLNLDGYLSVSTQAILRDVYASYSYPSLEDSIQIAQYSKQTKGNQLTQLPQAIEQLSLLEYLSIRNNQLSDLPTGISKLKSLKTLALSGNQLTSLPSEFGNFEQLESLDLSNNQLAELPLSMGNLPQLKTLFLSKNQLTALLPFKNCSWNQLEQLELNHNQLTDFPLAILKMSQLSSLELSHNQLTRLPNDLSSLRELEWMDLKGNAFEQTEQERIKRALPKTKVVFE